MSFSLKHLAQLVQPITAEDAASQADLLTSLREQVSAEKVVLYASGYDRWSFFLHAVLVPKTNLDGSWENITEWSGNPFDSSGCGLVYGGGQGPRIEMYSPWEGRQPVVLNGARQLVFGRSFDARIGQKNYFELAQEITHAHGLHWLDERQAWCRLNEEGDVVDIAKVEEQETSCGKSATLLWIDKRLLDMHMAATGTCLAQMFDSTRVATDFRGFNNSGCQKHCDPVGRIAYKFLIEGSSSYFRGVQFILPSGSAQDLGQAEYEREHQAKEFETFIIQDWKNNRVVEWSCAPEALASYFEKDSELPFQTSPVFFKPQVLEKYKADREKYNLDDRSITCRNAWHLQTYDVNESGQIHTYITYLGQLPIQEQRYWKSFNEAPKGPISQRAYQTDFAGSWDVQQDSLRELKNRLSELGRKAPSWFRIKQPDLIEHLHYPLTPAFKPWDDTLIDLAKTVVEGLERSVLVAIAKKNGSAGDPKWASIKWLREALISSGVDELRVQELISPLEEIQFFRTKLAAHAGVNEATEIRRRLLREHGTPRAHIEFISTRLNASLDGIAEIIE
jgi:hypothetical protein